MAEPGRIHARPAEVLTAAPVGRLSLGPDEKRNSYLYVPVGYRAEDPCPLLLFLHGSGGHALHGVELLRSLADSACLVLAAPVSADYMWDPGLSRFSRDVPALNSALEFVFERYAVDSDRIAIGGFSDGASCALSLGLANGDLFSHVIAFSPGEVRPRTIRGRPRVFLAHGVRDEIQPLFRSRDLVPLLERAGLDVTYREFEVGHRIPPEIARQAIMWLTKAPGPAADHPGRRASQSLATPQR